MAELKGLHELFESSTARLRVQPLNLDHLSESWNLLESMKKDVPSIEAKVDECWQLPNRLYSSRMAPQAHWEWAGERCSHYVSSLRDTYGLGISYCRTTISLS